MNGERTLYSILGVDPDAPSEVIKAAYRALAKQYHPDGNGAGSQEATAKFVELQEAYSVISDEVKRAEYNETIFGRADDGSSLRDEVDAEINADEGWDAKAKEHPEIVEIHQILAQYSSALANRFILAVESGECGDDPATYAFELEKAYFRKYFGDTPDLQSLARRLLQAGFRAEAQSLNKAINDARRESPSLEPWKINRIIADFEAILDSKNNYAASDERLGPESSDGPTGVDDGGDQVSVPQADESNPTPVGGSQRRSFGLVGLLCLLLAIVGTGYLTVSEGEVSLEGQPAAEKQPVAEDQTASDQNALNSEAAQISGDLAQLTAVEVCNGALNSSGDAWNSESFIAVEADNRGLTVSDCKVILGLNSAQDAKGNGRSVASKKQFDDRIAAETGTTEEAEPVLPIPGVVKKQFYERIVGDQVVAGEKQQLPTIAADKTSKEVIGNTTEVLKVDELPLIPPVTYKTSAQSEKPSILQLLSSKLLCTSVLASSYESSTPAFSSYPANQVRVNEARRRGLSVDDCLAITQTSPIGVAVKAAPEPEVPKAVPAQKRRVALVIGNSKYRQLPWLENPSRDASAMADSLASLGFEVMLVLDATQNDLRMALFDFSRKLGDDTSSALLYYSGHAVQISESNLLLPVDMDEQERDEVALNSLSLSEVLQVMNSQRVANKILILDACRNNPLKDVGGQGLATVKAGVGTFIAYSTQPGNVAEDGPQNRNSPYTEALLAALKGSSESIEETFKQVRSSVAKATDGRQVPWESSSLVEEFTLASSGSHAKGKIERISGDLSNQQVAPQVAVAEVDPTAARLPSQADGDDEGDAENVNLSARKKIPLETAYSNGDDEELGGMTTDASAAPAKPKLKPDAQDSAVAEGVYITEGYPVPKPRPKPIEVLLAAAVNMKIEAASAPPPNPTARPAPVAGNSQGFVISAETMTETASLESNATAKTSLSEEVENGDGASVPTIQSVTGSASGDDLFWWPAQLAFDTSKAVRRDGVPQQFKPGATPVATILPGVTDAQAQEAPAQPQRLAVAQMAPVVEEASLQETASGKGDMLVVNREGKGSLLRPFKPVVILGQPDVDAAQ